MLLFCPRHLLLKFGQNRVSNVVVSVVVVVVFVVVVVVYVVVVIAVIVAVDPRTLPLHFGQNQVNIRRDLADIKIV